MPKNTPKKASNNSKYQFNNSTIGNIIDKMSGGTINNYFSPNSTNSKLLWTGIIVFCGIGIGYLTNRLPDWDKIKFLGEHFLTLLGISIFALIQIFVTWKNS